MASATTGNVFSDEVKKQLECSVCMDLSTKEIFMCVNGHNVCSSCQKKLTACPVCRHPGRPENRNRLAEQLAQSTIIPCKNHKKGCKEKMIAKDLEFHLKSCKYCLKCQFEFCPWQGPILDLAEHAYNVHKENFVEVTDDGVVLMLNDFRSHDEMRRSENTIREFEKARYSTSMLKFYDHIFWYNTKVTNMFHFNIQLQLIGPIYTNFNDCVDFGAEFYYQLDSFSGIDAGLTYKNNASLIESVASSDKIFGEGLEGLECLKVLKGVGLMTYRLKIFAGTVSEVGFSRKIHMSQLRGSKPCNWGEENCENPGNNLKVKVEYPRHHGTQLWLSLAAGAVSSSIRSLNDQASSRQGSTTSNQQGM